MKKFRIAIVLSAFLLSTACSTLAPLTSSDKETPLRDSILSNIDRAPQSLTPPDFNSDPKAQVQDAAYLSSQSDYHFTMGETLSFEGQHAKAVEEFKLTLVYDPKSVVVRLRLATEYVRLGMVTEAVEQAEAALEKDPKNIEAHMLLGGMYSGLKMYDPARQQFSAVLQQEPGHSEAAIYLGALLAEEKRYDEAVKYFESLAVNKTYSEKEKAYYYIGRIHAEQGAPHAKQAEAAFTKALSLRAEYPEAVLALALLHQSNGKEQQMETLLRSYQDHFGADREMARLLSHHYLEKENYDLALEYLESLDGFERDNLNIKIQIALIQIEQKKYESAAQRLEEVLQQAPESDKVRYYLGAVYEEIKRPNLAISHYQKIPAGSSYFTEAVIHTANLQRTKGDMKAAIETMENALKAQDDMPQVYAFYATLLDDKKDYKKALQMLNVAVDKFPENTQLRFFYGTMFDRVGNNTETVAQMKKVLEIDKNHIQALNYLAYTLAETGSSLDEASVYAERALALQPNDGYILDTIGWIHFKRNHIEEAVKYLEAAYAANSDESIIAEHLGDAYLRFQMWQKAQKMYTRAAKLEVDKSKSNKIQEKIANVERQIQQPSSSSRSPASVSSPKAQ